MRNKDSDPIETNEWLEAINSVIEEEGVDRASYLLTKIAERLNQENFVDSDSDSDDGEVVSSS